MSVQTELDRIIGAVEAAHEKVVAKGGTSTRPFLVSNLADVIDTIPQGGGAKVATGIITPDEHGEAIFDCGFKPDVVYFPDLTWYEEIGGYTQWHCAIFALASLQVVGDIVQESFDVHDDISYWITTYSFGFAKEENGIRFVANYDDGILIAYTSPLNYIAVNYTDKEAPTAHNFVITYEDDSTETITLYGGDSL